MYVVINATDAVNADLQHAIVISTIVHTKVVVPKGIQKLTFGLVLKMFSIAEVQTKVISCYSANKSCLLQVVNTKAIAALRNFAILNFHFLLFAFSIFFTFLPSSASTQALARLS